MTHPKSILWLACEALILTMAACVRNHTNGVSFHSSGALQVEQRAAASDIALGKAASLGKAFATTCIYPDPEPSVTQLLDLSIREVTRATEANSEAVQESQAYLQEIAEMESMPLLQESSSEACKQGFLSSLWNGGTEFNANESREVVSRWVADQVVVVQEAHTALEAAVAEQEFEEQRRTEAEVLTQAAHLEEQRALMMRKAAEKVALAGKAMDEKMRLAQEYLSSMQADVNKRCQSDEPKRLIGDLAVLLNGMAQKMRQAENSLKGATTAEVSCNLEIAARRLTEAKQYETKATVAASNAMLEAAAPKDTFNPIREHVEQLCSRSDISKFFQGESPYKVRMQRMLTLLDGKVQQRWLWTNGAKEFMQLVRENKKSGTKTKLLDALKEALRMEKHRTKWLQEAQDYVRDAKRDWEETPASDIIKDTQLDPDECKASVEDVTKASVDASIEALKDKIEIISNSGHFANMIKMIDCAMNPAASSCGSGAEAGA